MAFDILSLMTHFKIRHRPRMKLQLRVGLHSGNTVIRSQCRLSVIAVLCRQFVWRNWWHIVKIKLESADLNQMLRHIYVVNNVESRARGLKFSKIYGEKRPGLTLETEAFCCRWRHLPISTVFNQKINFWKYLGGVQSFWRLCCRRRAREQRLEETEWKIKHGNDSKSVFRVKP